MELNRGLGTRLNSDGQQCPISILTATSSFVFPRKTFVVAGDSLCDHWLKLMHRRHIKTCPAHTDKRPRFQLMFLIDSYSILFRWKLCYICGREECRSSWVIKLLTNVCVSEFTMAFNSMDSGDFEPEARRRIFCSAWFYQKKGIAMSSLEYTTPTIQSHAPTNCSGSEQQSRRASRGMGDSYFGSINIWQSFPLEKLILVPAWVRVNTGTTRNMLLPSLYQSISKVDQGCETRKPSHCNRCQFRCQNSILLPWLIHSKERESMQPGPIELKFRLLAAVLPILLFRIHCPSHFVELAPYLVFRPSLFMIFCSMSGSRSLDQLTAFWHSRLQ